ncbi:metallophosphoesterase [Plastoroseomonas arctica]|uniref:Phosphatase n=1 Tax=Plastoroseomonas arctica TaxID=1509237 RepID=A0AAF1JY90_9PROT|nr:metallophosphoesterase [Plastoroseomonas arctica]MBR0655840.1 phosphatase [Plastoroseomonas arctica]
MRPFTRDDLRARGFTGLRVVGDVHGEAAAFEAACAGATADRLFVVQLGDLTDHGPDSPAVLRRMFGLIDAEAGLFLLGNHDHKLRRALVGAKVDTANGLALTLTQIEAAPDREALVARTIAEIARAPAWLRAGPSFFVHAGYHDAMLHNPPPEDAGARKPDGVVTRALFGQVTGRLRADGFPERLHEWIVRIPAGLTVYCGHEVRSRDGLPYREGNAVFLDTGAGKGGHLSWVDLPF